MCSPPSGYREHKQAPTAPPGLVLVVLRYGRAAKGWKSAVVPGILTSTSGYAIGTFIGLATGTYVLK